MDTRKTLSFAVVLTLGLWALCGPAWAIEDMISHWKFDEGEGSIAHDSAGTNDGTIYGAAWTTGQIDGALSFDGVNDYVDMADTVKNYLETSYTFSAWIKTNTVSSYTFISAYRHSIDGNPVLFQLYHDNEEIRFMVRDNSHNTALSTYTNALTTNTWYHIAGTRDENTVNVYVNGVSGIPDSEPLGEISPDNLKIGALQFGGNPPSYFFDGTIDDARIYDWALSEEEIQEIYREGIGSAWTVPVPVSEVNTEYNERLPFLSFDGLTLYFVRSGTDTFYYQRIYQAARPEPYGPFTSVEEISTLNYPDGDVSAPWVSPDNLRMYYFRKESATRRLKFTERVSIYDPWLPGTDISELNALGVLRFPSLTEDELTIFFVGQNLPGNIGEYDLWMATRPDMNSPFENARNLTEINSTAVDGGPYISPDGLILLFHSTRNGDCQIFRATRPSLNEPFENIEHLSFFDTPGGISGFPSLSSDGTAFYFNRAIGIEPKDIYVSYLEKPNKASAPYPADGATNIDPNVVLGWSPGTDALSHDVYIGTSYDDVNDADTLSDEYMGNYAVNSYDPNDLDLDTTYYWRIDEVADPNIYKGDVWNFTTWAEPPSDLVGWWKFDEGEGSIAHDSAGTNDGTIYGATWTTGQIEGALSFDGVDDYVNVIDSDDRLDIEDNITIAAWIKLNDLSDYYFIVGKQPTGTSRTSYPGNYIFRTWPTDGYLQLHHQTGTGDYEYSEYTSTSTIEAGAWHHVSVSLVEGGNVNFYVDSAPAGTVPQSGTFGLINDEPVRIGTRKDAFSYFNGSIDDVRIFNRALSEEEIQEVYKDGVCEPGYPCINVLPQILEFYSDEGGPDPEPQILSISNFGDGILNYQITEDCSWLEVDPNAGGSAGEPNEATVSVDISGLTCGLYECDLIVSDPDASNNPQIVHVQLEVYREDCQIDVRVVPVAVLIDPAPTSEVRKTLPESVPGVVQSSTYYIEIWASDTGEINTGLTGVYVDVQFCDQTSALAVEHGTIFVTFPDGTIQPDGVDEFGGSALPSGGGIEPDWVRVGWIQMSTEVSLGTCTISLLPSSTGIAALERGAIPWDSVDLDSVELQITPPVRSYDLDGDDFIGLADLSFFAGSWMQRVPPADEEHDFDCDSFVGVGDLSWFATGWQKNTDDPTILYPPCATGAEAASILSSNVLEMTGSNTSQTPFLIDIAFGLAVLDSPSSSDTDTILPTSVKKISAGQTYYLELWVSDIGYINTGLISAYVDLTFPDDALTVTDISYGGIFTLFNDESVLQGEIDELGGSTVDGVGIEPEWARVAVVQMQADATLPFVTFTLSPSGTGVAALGRGIIPWDDILLDSLLICPADFDNDADVDNSDLAIFASAWNTRPGDPQWNPDCDISAPVDIIDKSDLAWLVNSWLVGHEP